MHTVTAMHGVNVFVEGPSGALLPHPSGIVASELVGAPFGWGREFTARAGTRLWFHATPPLGSYSPSPTTTDRFYMASMGILRLWLQMSGSTDQIAAVDAVHLWEGHSRFWIKQFVDPRGISRAPRDIEIRPRRRNAAETWAHPRIFCADGMGISIRVRWASQGVVCFHAVKVEWSQGWPEGQQSGDYNDQAP